MRAAAGAGSRRMPSPRQFDRRRQRRGAGADMRVYLYPAFLQIARANLHASGRREKSQATVEANSADTLMSTDIHV
jgi:hypothetical protein